MERCGRRDPGDTSGEKPDKPSTGSSWELPGGMDPDELLMSPEWDDHLQQMREDEAEPKQKEYRVTPDELLLAQSDPEESYLPELDQAESNRNQGQDPASQKSADMELRRQSQIDQWNSNHPDRPVREYTPDFDLPERRRGEKVAIA